MNTRTNQQPVVREAFPSLASLLDECYGRRLPELRREHREMRREMFTRRAS